MKIAMRRKTLVLLSMASMVFSTGCELEPAHESERMDSGTLGQSVQGQSLKSQKGKDLTANMQQEELAQFQHPEPLGNQSHNDSSDSQQGVQIPPKPGEEPSFAFSHVDRKPVDHMQTAQALSSQKDFAGAILELEKALYDDPSDYDSALMLGNIARRSDRIDLATDSYMLCAQLEPDSSEPWLGMARLSLEQKQVEQAEQLAQRALDLKPESAMANNLLGRIWLERSHWGKAIKYLRKAVVLVPENIYYVNNLGFAFLLSKDFQSAVETLEPISHQAGAKAFMLNNLGLAYEGMGRLQDATVMFKKALEHKPRYVNAKINLERMVQVAKREQVSSSDEDLEQDEDLDAHDGSQDLIIGDEDEI